MNLDSLIEQIDVILGETSDGVPLVEVRREEPHGEAVFFERITRYAGAIMRYAPPGSVYRHMSDEILKGHDASSNTAQTAERLRAVLIALKTDLSAGNLYSTEQAIHCDVFTDFLGMASRLIADGFKDPAAVICGSVLAEHLRKLCGREGLSIEWSHGEKVIPKNVHQMNASLLDFEAYEQDEYHLVEKWNEIRIDALVGDSTKYTIDDVEAMMNGVRQFIARNPA